MEFRATLWTAPFFLLLLQPLVQTYLLNLSQVFHYRHTPVRLKIAQHLAGEALALIAPVEALLLQHTFSDTALSAVTEER